MPVLVQHSPSLRQIKIPGMTATDRGSQIGRGPGYGGPPRKVLPGNKKKWLFLDLPFFCPWILFRCPLP